MNIYNCNVELTDEGVVIHPSQVTDQSTNKTLFEALMGSKQNYAIWGQGLKIDTVKIVFNKPETETQS